MSKAESKTTTEKEAETTSNLKVYNFTRDGVVVEAKSRKEAEELLKERSKAKEDK